MVAMSPCQVDPAGATGQPTTLHQFCTREKWPTHPSGGLWPASLVGPAGTLYLTYIGGSQLIDMAGWTHDSYGGPTLEANARPADVARCGQAILKIPAVPEAAVLHAGPPK